MTLPSAVRAELTDPDAPPSVRNRIANPSAWPSIHETPGRQFDHGSVEGRDEGETAAIASATSLGADLLLMDDRKGVVLDIAAQRGLVNFAKVISRLRRTTFRIPDALLDSLLQKHAPEGSDV